jgi:UPF0755 protein
MINRVIKIGIWIVLGVMLIASFALFFYWKYLENLASIPGENNVRVELEIKRGTSPRAISRLLEENKLVKSAFNFYIYLRFVARKAENLKAGYYVIHGTYTPNEIIKLLQKGLKKELRFTIPEGASKKEIASIIEKAGLIPKEDMLNAMNNPELIREFNIPQVKIGNTKVVVPGGIEGYLFPDTYQFAPGTKGEVILRRMHVRMLQLIDVAMQKQMHEMQWSLHQVLTMASLVEKETGAFAERPLIASVFFNRLRHHMRLQTDPSVIYSIDNYDGNIRKKHLTVWHPYNTYAIWGLPPGPISSPGLESIRAVLWPEQTKYIYFVSRNDGTHVFCPTYTCHQKAVKQWQVDFFKTQKAATFSQ